MADDIQPPLNRLFHRAYTVVLMAVIGWIATTIAPIFIQSVPADQQGATAIGILFGAVLSFWSFYRASPFRA